MGQGSFRLPTEAEWEYACRAGSTTRFSFGDALECSDGGDNCAAMDPYRWWGNNTFNGAPFGTKEVGLKWPNAWGLFDMHGNVMEWCWDGPGSMPFVRETQIDPQGPYHNSSMISRGGSWYEHTRFCRSSYRDLRSPRGKYNYLGFRLVKTVEGENPTPTSIPAPIATPTPVSSTKKPIIVPLDLPSGAKPLELVLMKAGTFIMGSPTTERRRWDVFEWEAHPVTLTRDFYLGKYEVTHAQWQKVMGFNPSLFCGLLNHPVENVSWENCALFCNRLSQMLDLTPVYDETNWRVNKQADGFRLPTEAEWEYACRAGTTTRFSFGDALECSDEGDSCEIMDQYMWWYGNNDSNGDAYGTKAVGLKWPNPWGLFDMHGNVWEWCSDWWEYPYACGAQTDPKGPHSSFLGPNSSGYRVVRGGGWFSYARVCRSASRYDSSTNGRDYVLGLRLARTN